LHVFGVHVGTWQVPCVEPGGFTQPPAPAQQSAEVVHEPPLPTHEASQVYLPRFALKVHGFPQQSALVTQTVPAGGLTEQSPT
jgi:hypothetical protein